MNRTIPGLQPPNPCLTRKGKEIVPLGLPISPKRLASGRGGQGARSADTQEAEAETGTGEGQAAAPTRGCSRAPRWLRRAGGWGGKLGLVFQSAQSRCGPAVRPRQGERKGSAPRARPREANRRRPLPERAISRPQP